MPLRRSGHSFRGSFRIRNAPDVRTPIRSASACESGPASIVRAPGVRRVLRACRQGAKNALQEDGVCRYLSVARRDLRLTDTCRSRRNQLCVVARNPNRRWKACDLQPLFAPGSRRRKGNALLHADGALSYYRVERAGEELSGSRTIRLPDRFAPAGQPCGRSEVQGSCRRFIQRFEERMARRVLGYGDRGAQPRLHHTRKPDI
jgi:hypothetical protein